MNNYAEVAFLWVGECTPDTGSTLIQRVLGKNYSHNALIYLRTGMVWHSTFSDDPKAKANGVCEETVQEALKGCVVRAKKYARLHVNDTYFTYWLEQERGKRYAHEQNAASIWKWVQHLSLLQNGDQGRNCSEFVAAAAEMAGYEFPRLKDYITPADTYKVIKPIKCNEVVDSQWKLTF